MMFVNRFHWIRERYEYLAKMNNLPKHHGAGPNAAALVASAWGRPWLWPYRKASKWWWARHTTHNTPKGIVKRAELTKLCKPFARFFWSYTRFSVFVTFQLQQIYNLKLLWLHSGALKYSIHKVLDFGLVPEFHKIQKTLKVYVEAESLKVLFLRSFIFQSTCFVCVSVVFGILRILGGVNFFVFQF